MDELQINGGEVDEAISIMKEVAAWGRSRGFRVWLDEWLTSEKLITEEAQPENFFVGKINDKLVCAFILQWKDCEFWASSPVYEAAYMHKLCVRREFAHMDMTKRIANQIVLECKKRGIKYIRLDTALDEKVVRKIYLKAGFKIVDIIDYENGRSIALYELEI